MKAEAVDTVDITSAQITTDEKDQTSLNVDLNLINQTDAALKEIKLTNARLIDTKELQKDGYSYQVEDHILKSQSPVEQISKSNFR